MIKTEYSGGQREGVYDQMLNMMKSACLKNNGMALVNISLTPVIGNVRSVTNQSNVYSPGLHVVGLADCVQEVDKTSR